MPEVVVAAAPIIPVSPKSAAPSPAPIAPPAKSPEMVALEQDRAKLADERKAQELKMVRQQRKHADELKTKEKTWGEKLSKLGEYERTHAQAKLNPEAFLKGVYGDGWYDAVVQAKINNGIPTADVLASEIAKVEEKFEAKFAAKEAEREQAARAAQQQTVESARRQLNAEASRFWDASGKEFPVLEALGNGAQVSSMLTARIEAKYNSTLQRDESGQIVLDGQILTPKQAAEELEAEILGVAEKAAGHEKYAERFRAKLPTPKVVVAPKYEAQQPRRTLSNDLTGSTPGRPLPANDADKRARAIAAFDARRSKA